MEIANITVLLVGALTSLVTGLVTFLATRYQHENEKRRLRLEESRAEVDQERVLPEAATQIIAAAQTTTGMSLDLSQRYQIQIGELKAELQLQKQQFEVVEAQLEDCNILRAHLRDLINMVLKTESQRECPIGNETCQALRTSLSSFAESLKEQHGL